MSGGWRERAACIGRVDIDRALARRLMQHVRVTDGCWHWTGVLHDQGYGQVAMGQRGRPGYAHRLMYELLVGPIPEGLQLDHTCHDPSTCVGGRTCPHRRCCNPAHLEPVTHAENVRRGRGGKHQSAKTHCPHGHPYTADNTLINSRGVRECRTCRRGRKRHVA